MDNVIYKSYDDLCRQIDLLNSMLETYYEERYKILKMGGFEGLKELSGCATDNVSVMKTSQVDFIYAIERLVEIDKQVIELASSIEWLKSQKADIDQKLSEFDGIEEKVFYNRVVRGLSQDKTAEAIGRSIRHVRRIENRIKNI